MANRTKLTLRARRSFLETLAATGNVSRAAREIGLSRAAVYKAKEHNETFSAAWDDAVETACDALEAEAWRRGVEGVAKPLVSMGKLVKDDSGKVLEVRDYSDHMLLALLKAHRPSQYRENVRVELDIVGIGTRLDEATRQIRQHRESGLIDVTPAPVPPAIESKAD